jgi:hypothetical protein
MVNRNLAELVPGLQLLRELRHHLLGHPLVCFVVEVEHFAPTRIRPSRADERRDRAGSVVAHLGNDVVDRQRILGEREPTLWLRATWQNLSP